MTDITNFLILFSIWLTFDNKIQTDIETISLIK